MIRAKDILLLLIVTFMSVAFILPNSSIFRGLDRTYLIAGLLIVLTIVLAYYSKFVLVAAVLIAAIGANLPQEIAWSLNVEPRIFMVTLITIVLVAVANRIIDLPTGLDKPQGFPGSKGSVAPNRNIVELNLPENNSSELSAVENDDPESIPTENNEPVYEPALKRVVPG